MPCGKYTSDDIVLICSFPRFYPRDFQFNFVFMWSIYVEYLCYIDNTCVMIKVSILKRDRSRYMPYTALLAMTWHVNEFACICGCVVYKHKAREKAEITCDFSHRLTVCSTEFSLRGNWRGIYNLEHHLLNSVKYKLTSFFLSRWRNLACVIVYGFGLLSPSTDQVQHVWRCLSYIVEFTSGNPYQKGKHVCFVSYYYYMYQLCLTPF